MSDDSHVMHWSEPAEQAALGALLLDPEAGRSSDLLQRRDFYDVRHGKIFDAIRVVSAGGRPVDAISVFQHLQDLGIAADCGGLVYLNELSQSVVSTAHLHRHAEIIRAKAAQRELIAAADEALAVASGPETVDVKLDRILAMFAVLERLQARKAPRTMSELAMERMSHYEALEAGTVTAGWPTGFPRLDRMLNGGLRAGGLYILAARPAVGKSSLSQVIGTNLARDDHPTLFLSQEMAASEVADRSVASTGRVDSGELLSGKMTREGWARAVDALDTLTRLPLYVDDQGALTLREIKAKARGVKGLQVLVIDYLQLCSSALSDSNRNAQLEQLTRGLKAFAKEAGVAVLALSQLNRDVEKRGNKRPNLSDLRDSGAIEQDADVVLFLWPVREFSDRRILGLGVEKNRQGRTGEFALEFEGAVHRWEESTADIRPPTKTTKDDL